MQDPRKEEFREQAEELIRYAALVYERGLVSAAGGNVSIRVGSDQYLITGSNVPLRAVTPEGLVLCSGDGTVLQTSPGLRPSKETAFHLAVYQARPEIHCVLHAHPNYAVIWSLQDKPLPMHSASARLKLREVPVIPDADPGSVRLAQLVTRTVQEAPMDIRTFLMEAHGILALGETMEECFENAELLEDTAKIAVFTELLSRKEK